MNTPQLHGIYLLNNLMTSLLWDIARHESLLRYNVGYEKCSTLFSTMVILDFDNFCIIGNRNEYSTERIHFVLISMVQTLSFQPNYVSILPDKTKYSTKTAERLL